MINNKFKLLLIKLLLCVVGFYFSIIMFNHVTAWGGIALSALSLVYAIKIIYNLITKQ